MNLHMINILSKHLVPSLYQYSDSPAYSDGLHAEHLSLVVHRLYKCLLHIIRVVQNSFHDYTRLYSKVPMQW